MSKPFQPGVTTSITAAVTSGAIAIPLSAESLELQNAGDVTVFVRWSNVSPTAVVTDYPILPGQSKVVTCNTGNGFLAAITGSGTALLYVTGGEGF